MAEAVEAGAAAAPALPMAPVGVEERVRELDLLRGFAIFGILLVNMGFFGAPLALQAAGIRWFDGPVDRAAEWLIRFLAQGKFYSLFSFLFGLGFALQMVRAQARGAAFGSFFRRRLLALLLIGTVHALLVWMGDILATYALIGFLLLFFRRRQPKTIAIWAVVCLMLPALLVTGLAGYMELVGSPEMTRTFAEMAVDARRQVESSRSAYGHGTFAQITQQRVTDVAGLYSFFPFFFPSILGMFLWGLWVGKRGILNDLSGNLGFLRKVQRYGLALGIVGNLAFVISAEYSNPATPSLVGAAGFIGLAFGAPALCFFYATTLVLLFRDPVWRRRLDPLAAVGRTALSNYLLQSLVCTTLFYSYGLAWYGKVGPALGLALTLALFAFQIPLSNWWVGRFRYGPGEWLWRSLTYGRPQPMRLAPAEGPPISSRKE